MPSKKYDPDTSNANVKDDADEVAVLVPSYAEKVREKVPACASFVEGVTLKYLFEVRVFAFNAL